MRYLLPVLLLLHVATVQAEQVLELASGNEISYEVYGAKGATRILLMPSEAWFEPQERAFAQALVKQGFEVWQPQLHASYFINPGPFSFAKIPVTDIVELLEEAHKGGKPLYVIADQRASVLALEASYQQQRKHPGQAPRGLILISPYLEVTAPEAGEGLKFHPITARSNLPIYIVQPKSSSRFFHLEETRKALARGGSQVLLHVVPNARESYHIWPEQIEPNEMAERRRLPARLRQAIALLSGFRAAPLKTDGYRPPKDRRNRVHATPQPYKGNIKRPHLDYPDLAGRRWSAGQLRGQVVLVNLWATWCPPCVQELPTLERLHKKLKGTQATLVSLDVGEDKATIEGFLKRNKIKLTYPILIDAQGEAARHWRITGFPSSFILDRQGRIRYGLIGAIEWDSDEIVDLMLKLAAE